MMIGRTRRYRAYRDGITSAKADAALFGTPRPNGEEDPHRWGAQSGDLTHRLYAATAYARTYWAEVEARLDRMTPAERDKAEETHYENSLIRNAGDPRAARDILELKRRIVSLERIAGLS